MTLGWKEIGIRKSEVVPLSLCFHFSTDSLEFHQSITNGTILGSTKY